MPGLTAINNTYTANTPRGVRDCLHFLQRQGRDGGRRETENTLRLFPVSIVYGCGSERPDCGLVTKGDDLDIVPTRWDTVRRRRWWDVSRDASKQMLLPFPEHARVRITRIDQYNHTIEFTIRVGPDQNNTELNLVAPGNMSSAPGLYTVRAIRIHNVDGSETVPPMRSTANSAFYPQSQQVRGMTAEATTAFIDGDWGNTLHNNAPYSDEECEAIDDMDWHCDEAAGPIHEPPTLPSTRLCGPLPTRPVEPNPCGEVPGPRPRRPSGEAPMWTVTPEPPTPPPTRPRGPRIESVIRTVPIRDIVSRADVDRAEREARDYQSRRLRTIERERRVIPQTIPLTQAQARAVGRTGFDESQEGVGDESCRLRPMPRTIAEAQARAVRRTDLDRAREDVESRDLARLGLARACETQDIAEAREDVDRAEREARYRHHCITLDVDMSVASDQVEAFMYAAQAIGRCVRNDTT